jgi:putative ABC transport system ATP-binding protein
MDRTIYGFIFRYSKAQQIFLLIVTCSAFPFIYLQPDIVKRIVNDAIRGSVSDFPKEVLGFEFEQIPFLILMCFGFLLLVIINGGFKFFINSSKGRLGERMLRRLRYTLYGRVLRFPLPHFKRVSQGEVIPMITQEVEPLGGFIGDAIAQPVFQAGMLITFLIFIIVQDWMMGCAAMAMFPIQGYIIPKLQKKVNALGKRRVQAVRRVSERISESINGIQEVHSNDASNLMRAEFAMHLGRIYDIRFEIYQRKFIIKFINNTLAQFTPFLFYLIGGYLVIEGDLSIGALIGVISAHKDMNSPWKELLAFYQQYMDARIKYEQVVEQFDPPGMLDESLQLEEPESVGPIPRDATVAAQSLTYQEDETSTPVQNLNLEFKAGERLALTGPSGGGKDELAALLARLLTPTGGRVAIAGEDLAEFTEARTGRRLAYVGPAAYLFSDSVRANLLFGLKHRPLATPEIDEEETAARTEKMAENDRAGNTDEDFNDDWVDYKTLGVDETSTTDDRLIALLEEVDLTRAVYDYGLRSAVDLTGRDGLSDRILEARARLSSLLAEQSLEDLVEPYDPEKYNDNASLAENLLFGTVISDKLNVDALGDHEYVLATIKEVGLTDHLLGIGRETAALMLELFADVEPGDALFEQYSFIKAEDLPEYQIIVAKFDRGSAEALNDRERSMLLTLTFKLIPARHRLGLITDEIRERVIEARKHFRENMPEDLAGAVEFFDPAEFNAVASVQDNILFGKIAYGQAEGPETVGRLIDETVDELGLRRDIVGAGLEFQVGIGGSRLSGTQRQKIAIARALAKQPDILILSAATDGMDTRTRHALVDRVLAAAPGGVVWAVGDAEYLKGFDRAAEVAGGKVVNVETLDSAAAEPAS